MNWQDRGIVLAGRKFGEGGLILDVLTAEHGRRLGLVYGGASRTKRGQYETGNTVKVAWSGRLEGQLGRFDVAEALDVRAAHLLDTPLALAAIRSVAAMLREALNEGDSAGAALFEATEVLLNSLQDDDVWPALYARWELGLLEQLGFGIDLTACAVTGGNAGLTHVSPRTGRAVIGSEVEDYVERLFRLPNFLMASTEHVSTEDISDALALTGFFLKSRHFGALNRDMPEARDRLVRLLHKQTDHATTPRSRKS